MKTTIIFLVLSLIALSAFAKDICEDAMKEIPKGCHCAPGFHLVCPPKQNALQACIPFQVSEEAVAGRIYVQVNSPNPHNPIYITFGSFDDLTASYGRPSDGNPGGEYKFHGNCHAEIILTFKSIFGTNPQTEEVLHLKPLDSDYFKLQATDGTVFTLVH